LGFEKKGMEGGFLMKDILAFIIFIAGIVIGIVFYFLRHSLVKEGYFDDIRKGPFYYGVALPIILYFVLEGGPKGLDWLIATLLIVGFFSSVFIHSISLKENPVTLSGRAVPDSVRTKIILVFIFSPVAVVVYFVTLVVIVSSIKDALKRSGKGD